MIISIVNYIVTNYPWLGLTFCAGMLAGFGLVEADEAIKRILKKEGSNHD